MKTDLIGTIPRYVGRSLEETGAKSPAQVAASEGGAERGGKGGKDGGRVTDGERV